MVTVITNSGFHSFNRQCETEAQRLRIAEQWANVNRSKDAIEFDRGRADRLAGSILTVTIPFNRLGCPTINATRPSYG